MLKSIVLIFCCVCVAVVVSEAAALAVLWKSGMLTAHHVHEIRLIFSNSVPDEERERDAAEAAPLPSMQEVAEARAMKVLDFEKREGELTVLKNMAMNRAVDLDDEQARFRAEKKAFGDELARIEADLTSAATEQARGVLLALPPKDAVEHLMQLSLDEDVVLLKGMSEKLAAKILKEFKSTPEQLARGREIFEAISRGLPVKELVDDAQKKFATEN
jgi:hypothetical protein